jgi:hypothetical protein
LGGRNYQIWFEQYAYRFNQTDYSSRIAVSDRTFILPVCPATLARAQLPETSDSNAKQTNLLKDEFYFGLTKPGAEILSESEWQKFVKTVITPRFREGLTVLDCSGQFLNRRENSEQEKTLK